MANLNLWPFISTFILTKESAGTETATKIGASAMLAAAGNPLAASVVVSQEIKNQVQSRQVLQADKESLRKQLELSIPTVETAKLMNSTIDVMGDAGRNKFPGVIAKLSPDDRQKLYRAAQENGLSLLEPFVKPSA